MFKPRVIRNGSEGISYSASGDANAATKFGWFRQCPELRLDVHDARDNAEQVDGAAPAAAYTQWQAEAVAPKLG